VLSSSHARAGIAFGGTLDDWANLSANKPAIDALDATLLQNTANLVANRGLTGWGTTLPGAHAHDGFMADFGWEYMTLDP
jgi:hypothetical protein